MKSCLAGFLLVLFAFSITPKKALHDWIVTHQDEIFVHHDDGTPHLHKAGFNCNCDNFVAESPFTGQEDTIECTPFLSFIIQQEALPCSFHSNTCFFFELRGPPSLS